MTWTYHQSTCEIDHDGKVIGKGYAGKKPWQNQPGFQSLAGKGPLPQGKYTIAKHFIDDQTTGKHSLRLTPDPRNHMFGRSRFLIHGDNRTHVGDSSDGCIVTRFDIRLKILHSNDSVLEVVP